MSSIVLSGLVKRFGDFTAIKSMDLEVRDGEFLALLGPSGCGKSTTMNIIAGMEAPTEGTVHFGERNITGVPMEKRGVGFVFQNYAIFTHMTVYDNLAYGPRMHKRPKAEIDQRVREMADFLELTSLLNEKTAGLSVNILQRIAIGRSAILEPAIFLLDEPLSNVDAAFRAVMRQELKQLQRRFKQTMVYVTHDQLEAMTMADRIAVMDHGVLLQVGTPIEVYDNPRNLFVAQFIGSPGMNLLKGKLAERRGKMFADLDEAGGSVALDDETAAIARKAKDREVVYGFRPEEVSIAKGGLKMAISFVERIGARTIVHLGEGVTSVKAVFDNDVSAAIGKSMDILPQAGSVRLFSAATGEKLEPANG